MFFFFRFLAAEAFVAAAPVLCWALPALKKFQLYLCISFCVFVSFILCIYVFVSSCICVFAYLCCVAASIFSFIFCACGSQRSFMKRWKCKNLQKYGSGGLNVFMATVQLASLPERDNAHAGGFYGMVLKGEKILSFE